MSPTFKYRGDKTGKWIFFFFNVPSSYYKPLSSRVNLGGPCEEARWNELTQRGKKQRDRNLKLILRPVLLLHVLQRVIVQCLPACLEQGKQQYNSQLEQCSPVTLSEAATKKMKYNLPLKSIWHLNTSTAQRCKPTHYTMWNSANAYQKQHGQRWIYVPRKNHRYVVLVFFIILWLYSIHTTFWQQNKPNVAVKKLFHAFSHIRDIQIKRHGQTTHSICTYRVFRIVWDGSESNAILHNH